MDKKRKYNVCLLAFGLPALAGAVWTMACPNAWALAAAPVLGALGAAASWCAVARLVFCRRPSLLEPGFTRPLMLLFLPILWLLYTLALLGLAPAHPAAQENLATALAVLLGLAGVALVPAVFVVCAVASLFCAVQHMRRSAGRHPLYREGPFAAALIWCIGLVTLCVVGLFYFLV